MKKYITPFTKWLFCSFAFITLLITIRNVYSGNTIYLFLLWNLFLAWVPYAISLTFKNLYKQKKIIQCIYFAGWILFFPNALYIVTDIIHVKESSAVPVWYDAILLFTSSLVGLALAFASLKKVAYFLTNYFSEKYLDIIMLSVLFISSFGVYLGRFERWNSWDILQNPLLLANNIAEHFTKPLTNYKTWGITTLLTIFYTIVWYFSKLVNQASSKTMIK